MKYEDALQFLFDKFPQLKEEDEKEKAWRSNVERSYMLMGNTKAEANRMAWDDYWKMVEQRDGVTVSFHEIGDEGK